MQSTIINSAINAFNERGQQVKNPAVNTYAIGALNHQVDYQTIRRAKKVRKEPQDHRKTLVIFAQPNTHSIESVVFRLDVDDEGNVGDASNFIVLVHEKTVAKEKETPILITISSPRTQSSQDNVSRYLNENPAPSLEDVSLPRIVGTSGLNSHDRISRKENPIGDYVDQDWLPESQIVIVPK
ncbi:hypothetical protein Tco_0659971, partial [Tanacetum coccineum]